MPEPPSSPPPEGRSQPAVVTPPPVSDPLPGSSVQDQELRGQLDLVIGSHYEIDREIGRGGMGIVYRATDRRLRRPVAIKVLPPELSFRSEIRTRFLKEAQMAAQLSHQNIVPIFSVDERQNLVYFVMACVDGENVAQRLHSRGPFDSGETRRVIREVAAALAYAHSRGVVHRDIKPDNIILESASGRVMVTDFGIARAVTDTDSRLTATGIAIGTPAFMSPEQSVGDKEIDGRSDLYSLGIVGYQMLCGHLPFTASNTPAMLMKHISEVPERIDDRCEGVEPDLADAVMLLLEKSADDRFQSAEELVTALETGALPEMKPGVKPATPSHSRPVATRTPARREAVDDARSAVSWPEGETEITDDEIRRWNALPVREFRKKLATFIPVNLVILLFAIMSERDVIFFSLVWSVYLAYKYAGLWSDGYDWRDVGRYSREQTAFDVASDFIDNIAALFDRGKRREMREKSARRRAIIQAASRRSSALVQPGSRSDNRAKKTNPSAKSEAVPGDPVVREATRDRDEIRKMIMAMPRRERSELADVEKSAEALHRRIVAIRLVARNRPEPRTGARQQLEEEIRSLEEQANPLDASGSDARVKRLAQLRRQLRAITGDEDNSRAAQTKLEDCSAALRNIRLDLVRLRAGADDMTHVTLLAERALQLARDVDAVVAAEEAASGRRKNSPGREGERT